MKTYTQVEALRLWALKIKEGVMPGYDSASDICFYRSHSNKKSCAIGVLIPYEVLDHNISAGVDRLGLILEEREGFLVGDMISGVDMDTLIDIQNIHDKSATRGVGNKGLFYRYFFEDLQATGKFKNVPDCVWTEILEDIPSP